MTNWSRISPILQSSALAAAIVAGCAGPVAPGTTGPAPTPSPSPPTAAPSPSPGATAFPSAGGVLEPGTYTTKIGGYRWTFKVTGESWESGANPSKKIFVAQASETDPQYFAAVLVYGPVTDVVEDACHWRSADVFRGTNAHDYAAALAQIEGFETSGPEDIEVSGYRGNLVRLAVPSDADIDSCDGGEYHSFMGRFDYDPGQVEEVRVMDLDGVGYLYFTVVSVGTPADVMSDLDQMVDSLEIEPAE